MQKHANRWHLGFVLGYRDAEDAEDGGVQRTGQDAANHAPLEMLLNSISAVVKSDRAKKEKAEGFDMAMEHKKRQNAEEQLQIHCRPWDRL